MGIFNFIKDAGAKLFGSEAKAATADDLKTELAKHNLNADDLGIQVDGDKVTVSGKTQSTEVAEKITLALGNVLGISQVNNLLQAPAGTESRMYTVQKGDTLSKISKEMYGNPNLYQQIFEANKPMLTHPDKIYPGQVLRIPPQ